MTMPDYSLSSAVQHFWLTRINQGKNQGKKTGRKDSGNRSLVTGGKQMDGFESTITRLLIENGVPEDSIHSRSKKELPGFFRAEKQWDMVVVDQGVLLAAVEFKSQVGSFGNNFNNRSEEAIGSAHDLWTAFREGKFAPSRPPWVGYIMLLEDVEKSTTPVKVNEPHFQVFEEFKGASYEKRFELLIIRLIRERLYNSAAFIMSELEMGKDGWYREPNPEIGFKAFALSLVSHVSTQYKLNP